MDRVTVPAGRGASVRLGRGDAITITNTSGTQVVDLWCLAATGDGEHLSMGHCREVLARLWFDPGDELVSDRYTPLLRYDSDTSGGRHDTLVAACNPEMYRRFGRPDEHPSCASNLHDALRGTGLGLAFTPQPWNLFMRAPVAEDGSIAFVRPPYAPGAEVALTALEACLLVLSSCPDDCYPTNGGDGSPRDVDLVVRRAPA